MEWELDCKFDYWSCICANFNWFLEDWAIQDYIFADKTRCAQTSIDFWQKTLFVPQTSVDFCQNDLRQNLTIMSHFSQRRSNSCVAENLIHSISLSYCKNVFVHSCWFVLEPGESYQHFYCLSVSKVMILRDFVIKSFWNIRPGNLKSV